jgi:microcystin-dependent protein
MKETVMGAVSPFVGEIHMFAGNFAPTGYAFCNGQVLPISQNTALFSLLGTTYGGNGVSTFALPDLRGRTPLNFGQGPGLTPYSEGETGGAESVTLTQSLVPPHTHNVSVSNAAGTTANPQNATWAAGSAGSRQFATPANAGATVPMAATMLGAVGGSGPHNNMQPSLAINFIIALQGVFPSRP